MFDVAYFFLSFIFNFTVSMYVFWSHHSTWIHLPYSPGKKKSIRNRAKDEMKKKKNEQTNKQFVNGLRVDWSKNNVNCMHWMFFYSQCAWNQKRFVLLFIIYCTVNTNITCEIIPFTKTITSKQKQEQSWNRKTKQKNYTIDEMASS